MSHNIENTFDIDEDSTPDYIATLLDKDDNPVPGSVLDTLTLTFYQEYSGDIINSRDKQNVLQINNVTVAETGELVWHLTREDTVILDDALMSEPHVALFEYTFPGAAGTEYAKKAVRFLVDNFVRVP